MSSEIEVTETPNWLQELEAKREKRLKARLAHETGAGAPCLKCGEKCPGLDLHFWRKCCKICKCAKEEHEVQDDDIYGWAQFQLLGSKPNKIKTKIVLPGKKDEVELDWAPKGHKETVDKYLKTLPPEQLPVKGSQAAQDRKQLLQKQIPIHDIDPTLCHELTKDELNKMNDYVDHIKQTSVGVGQLVSLSSIIKGNLHKLNPNEAAIIASRYAKGVPLSEIVKLQSQNRASLLKGQNINQGLEKLNINDPHNKTLPSYTPNSLNTTEHNLNPLVGNKIHDVNYPGYTRDVNQTLPNAQFSSMLKPGQQKGQNQSSMFDPTIDEKLLQGTNFDPKSTPSHFVGQNVGPNSPYKENLARYKPGENVGAPNSAFVPYSKVSNAFRPGDNYIEENTPSNVNYTSSLPGRGKNISGGFKSGNIAGQNVPVSNIPGGFRNEQNYTENVNPLHPNYSKNLDKGLGNQNLPGYQSGRPQTATVGSGDQIYENVEEMKKNAPGLPNYVPGKYNLHSEIQSPSKVPRNVRDLAFSTYDQSGMDPNEIEYNTNDPNASRRPNIPYGQYPAGFKPDPTGAIGSKTIDRVSPSGRPGDYYPSGFRPVQSGGANQSPSGNVGGRSPSGDRLKQNVPGHLPNVPYENYPAGTGGDRFNQNVAGKAPNVPYENYPVGKDGNRFNPNIVGNPPNIPLENYPGGYDGNRFNQNVGSTPNMAQENYPSGKDGNRFNQNVAGNPPNMAQENYPAGYDGNRFNQNVAGNPHNLAEENYPAGYDGNRFEQNTSGYQPNTPYESYPGGEDGDRFSQNISGHPPNMPYRNYPASPAGVNKAGKKLSELHPGKISVDEDFLQPSQVTIGAIQDINYPEIKAATHGTNDFYEDYSPDSLREILNNIILPDCHYCKKPFEENEFAITIDRANVLFHAECFKCAGCNQILADNVYFYNKETDNVYCGRDYAKIRGFPRCKACDELIFTKEYCLAENSTFHLKHFCCIECDKPLAGQDYTLEDEMPYCLPCFEQSKASKCNACCNVIKPDEVGCNLNGVHFHASDNCFACKMCKKPLMGKKLLLKNGKLYCSHDCFGADK